MLLLSMPIYVPSHQQQQLCLFGFLSSNCLICPRRSITSIGFNHLHALTPQKQEDRWVRFSATFVQWDGACICVHMHEPSTNDNTMLSMHIYACIGPLFDH